MTMKITICGSMVFSEKQMETKKKLEELGHEVFVSGFINSYIGKSEEEIEERTIFNKKENDAILEHWNYIKNSDAILVLNYERRGIKNYIGGNTFLEIGFAHVLGKKIFLMNHIPDMEIYKSEIEAVKPVVIEGDLKRIS